MKKKLILGIGNLLMGDEGVGIHVVHYLQKNIDRPDLDIVDGGTGGFHLLEFFFNYDRIILIDASVDERAPGTVTLLRPKYTGDYPKTLVAHDIGLKDLLDAIHLLDKQPEIVLFAISISGASQVSLDLSPKIQSAIQIASEKILEYLSLGSEGVRRP